MLNKLLKKCMPWMDKGRWYKITIDGSSPETVQLKYDPVFSDVHFEVHNMAIVSVTFPSDRIGYIIDIKFVGRPGISQPDSPDLGIISTPDGFNVTIPGPGTIWLFINFG